MSANPYLNGRSLRSELGMDTRASLRRMHPLERFSAERAARNSSSWDNWFPVGSKLDFVAEQCLSQPERAGLLVDVLRIELNAAPGPVRCPAELRAAAAARWAEVAPIIEQWLAEVCVAEVAPFWRRKWRRVCRQMVAAGVAP